MFTFTAPLHDVVIDEHKGKFYPKAIFQKMFKSDDGAEKLEITRIGVKQEFVQALEKNKGRVVSLLVDVKARIGQESGKPYLSLYNGRPQRA